MLWRLNGSVSPPNLVVKTQNYSVEERQILPLKTFNNPIKISFRELTVKLASLIKTYCKKQTFRAATTYLQFLINAKSTPKMEGK